jgi:hypothetical protein
MASKKRPKKPECYLLVVIGPLGFDYPADVRWLSKPPESLYQYTRGEGQALLFKLENYDASTEFHEALLSGEAQEAYGKIAFALAMSGRKPNGKQQ